MKKTQEDIKEYILKCPKTIKEIKAFYIKKSPEMEKFLTDQILHLTITKSPSAIFEVFDTLGMICTLEYFTSSKTFNVQLNGLLVTTSEGEKLQSSDREGALILAVIFLLEKREKTL